MEASLLSAAVIGMLKILGNKLAPLVIKEYSSIVGVKKDLQELQDQVQEINFNLERVGDRDPTDAPWLKKLKEVVYDIDDIVDEFQLKAERHEIDGDGGFVSKCLLTKKAESLVLQCRAAKNIKKINKRFAKIVKQRNDMKAIFGDDLISHINKTTTNMQTLPVEEPTVLGRDQEMHQIISDLVENNDKNEIKIVSIVGLGGSGKTTLAKQVFNDGETIENHFEVRLWVYVSQEFDIETIIKKLYEAFADKDQGQPSLPYMSKRVKEGLTNKKFLIVMDDVWTESQIQWDTIMGYLKNGAPGSGVLLTTRSAAVAEVVRSTHKFCLQPLSPYDSWQLFQQSLGMAMKHLESEFVKVGKKIVKKCGGVPLAIKVVAGVLHGKELIGEWQAMRDSNLLDVEGEEACVSVSRCLRLSYFHLPSHMKQCFTMCSVFPKGYMIDKEQLIDQWIANDMLTPQASVEILDIGDKYFNSLVQMSFLQDVAENSYGRVKCRMHDLVHDLALSILDDKISLVVPKEATRSAKSCRYFSLIKQPKSPASKKSFRNARAVYIPRYGDHIYLKAMKHAKHLRSVMVGDVNGKQVDTISQVKYLKYLAMSIRHCEMLPKGISNVWSLQALHVTQSYSLLELPKSIGKLKMLRTLNLSGCIELKCLPDSIGDCEMISSIDLCNCNNLTMLPGSIGNLRKLRALNLSSCERLTMLPDSIGRNEMLRVLRLSFTKIERLPSDITTLRNLECLDLQGCHELVELPEGIGKLEKLQVLNLKCCEKIEGMPVGIGQLNLLQRLVLFVVGKGETFAGISELANVSRLGDELTIRGISHVMDTNDAHMTCLKEKTNLERLGLNWWPTNMEEVNTELQQDVLDGLEPPHRMKELQIHGYSGRHYARWMQNQVGGGVQGPAPFPFLRVMKLSSFPKLKNLHGLVELPLLELLQLKWMPYLESISGDPFPSLVRLEMVGLDCLGEMWMVAERTMPDGDEGRGCNFKPQFGQVRVGNCLTHLLINECPKLEIKPHLPLSLQYLSMHGSEQLLQSPGQCDGSSSPPNFNQLKKLALYGVTGLGFGHGWELLQYMTALESLEIAFRGVETELPESLWSLTSLRCLQVRRWSNICMLPESIGELHSLQELTIQSCDSLTNLPQTIGQLMSLQLLVIKSCKSLHQLPDCLGELCSLRKLEIEDLPELTCLPESICRLTSSLQELEIYSCPVLTSLPQGIEGLASLEKLSIKNCRGLTSLPQGMKGLVSLEELWVSSCPGIKSLPEGIKGLTALKKFRIWFCPDLKRRCKTETGEDWHLISHIPHVSVV